MTLQKPRLHKPRNAQRPASKSAAKTGRTESAGSPAAGLNIAPAIEALELLLDLSHPADAQLSAFFRNYPNFGARDRSFIAEAVYGVLRRLRSLQVLARLRDPAPSAAGLAGAAWRSQYARVRSAGGKRATRQGRSGMAA